jgi:thiosulfate dehydrogenase
MDGNSLDFKSSDGVQGISWLAFDNPEETLHKIRFGHPGSEMPSMPKEGLTNSEQGDILAYAQALSSYITGGANAKRGGLLYDKWWKVNGGTEPTTDFSAWASQSTNTRSGADTWRCKECHGWDYVGKDGRYSSGSHYTGFEGVWDQRNDQENNIFDAIKGTGTNHDLSAVLSDVDIADLTKFILESLFDMSLYISNGLATGNAANGQGLYDANCASCHGLDGNDKDFKSSDGIQGIGWIAIDNPQETLHKIRYGHPGSSMPSMLETGLTNEDQGDILAYSQTL